jgi:hypothetical protein
VTATKFDSPAFQNYVRAYAYSIVTSISLLFCMPCARAVYCVCREKDATEAAAAEMRCAGDRLLDVWPILKAAR